MSNKKKTNKITQVSKRNFKPINFEKTSPKSQTVAGEVYTIKELIQRHVNGLMPNIGKQPIYDFEEAHHDDPTLFREPNFDLTDLDTIKQTIEKTHKYKQNIKKKIAKQALEGEPLATTDRTYVPKAVTHGSSEADDESQAPETTAPHGAKKDE